MSKRKMTQKRDRSAAGAKHNRIGLSDSWRAWRHHHWVSALESLGRIAETPLHTLMTTLVIAIAIVLPAALLVGLHNIQTISDKFDAKPRLTLYLKMGTSLEQAQQLNTQLQSQSQIEQVNLIPPEKALQDFLATSGFGEVLSGLDQNPLPFTLVISPSSDHATPQALQQLRQNLQSETTVEEVALDMDWVQRLNAFMALGRQLVFGFAVLLGLGVLLVIGNTIRLEIERRRDEIVVAKLVGATDGFVRRPFLYTGVWYGIIGGLLACLILSIGVVLLRQSVGELAASYQSDFLLEGLGFLGALVLLVCSFGVGLLGASVSVSQQLNRIHPT